MSDKVDTAVRSMKAVGAEITQWENRLSFVQDEVKRATKTRDDIQSEIDKKMGDYNIFIAQRDAESKKIRQDVLDQQTQLVKDKEDFQAILQQFQKDKAVHLEQKSTVDNQNAKYEKQMNNIREFIIAVQRASSLLGL